jgi:hypothetical protein
MYPIAFSHSSLALACSMEIPVCFSSSSISPSNAAMPRSSGA